MKMNLKKQMCILCILLGIIITTNVQAIGTIETTPYSEEYEKWLLLDEEEREALIEPLKYEILRKTTNEEYIGALSNPITQFVLLQATNESSYDLRDKISANMTVKNQETTPFCWAFASNAVLETSLAVKDLKNGADTRVYDFSEKFMAYTSFSNVFSNNNVNEYGVYGNFNAGGSFLDATRTYLNGLGAVNEEDVPFVNSTDLIDISSVQNKTPQTTVKDIVIFSQSDNTDTQDEMKQHINLYGGLSASIHGASSQSSYFNNDTGALYVDDNTNAGANHAVTIVGWDDNYSKTNFVSGTQPKNNGAWIAKNSWGDKNVLTESQARELIYEVYIDQLNQMGYYNSQDIPSEIIVDVLEQSGYEYDANEDVYTFVYGDEGYIYISYEDANVYLLVWGIENATNEVEYEKTYSNDKVGATNSLTYNKVQNDKTYLANTFTRETNVEERINSVSIFTLQEYGDCKVYYTLGDSKNKEDFIEVTLQDGETSYVKVGYNTIELATPIIVNESEFTIILEIQDNMTEVNLSVETKTEENSHIEVNSGESFVSDESTLQYSTWIDLGEKATSNLIIKANIVEQDIELENIQISEAPNKIIYTEGENFIKTGMVVEAIYSDNTKSEIQNYTITNAENLQIGQTEVVISYTENGITKTATQSIKVVEQVTEEDVEEPELADFSSYKVKITDVEGSYEDSILAIGLELEISNLILSENGTTYEFSYYASCKNGQTNIDEDDFEIISEDDIIKNSNGTHTIKMSVSVSDFESFLEVILAEELYIYIKQVASLNDLVKTSIDMITITPEDIEYEEENNGGDIEAEEDLVVDTTVSTTVLPNTGKKIFAITLVCIVVIWGIVGFLKSRRIGNIK